jgi:hypothetical protein
VDWEWDRDTDPRVLHRWEIAEVGTENYTRCFVVVVSAVYIPRRVGLP